ALGSAYAVADAALIANNAGNIVSDNGAGIVSDNGAGLIANVGGGLTGKVKIVSDNGAGIVGKVKWGLLQAGGPTLGTEMPIAGMLLAVVSLADGKPIPVGQAPDGTPVYVVHSDARGRYELYL